MNTKEESDEPQNRNKRGHRNGGVIGMCESTESELTRTEESNVGDGDGATCPLWVPLLATS